MWIKRLLLFCLILGQAGLVHAQGQLVSGQAIVNTTTSVSGIPGNTVLQAVPNAQITVCSALGGGIPCSPLVTIYSNVTLSVVAPNPFTADANGNFTFYVPPLSAGYIYSLTGPGIVGQLYQIAPTIGGGGGGGTPGNPGNSVQLNCAGSFCGAAGISSPDGNQLFIKGPAPWTDIVEFGARGISSPLGLQTTASFSGGSPNVTVAAANFISGDGVTIQGAGATNTMSTPTAPTVVPSYAAGGTRTHKLVNSPTGASTYLYAIVAEDIGQGLTAPSPTTTIAMGLASLGVQTVGITSVSRSNDTMTVNLASSVTLTFGQLVYISMPGTQWAGEAKVASSAGTSFTVTGTPYDTRSAGSSSTDALTSFTGSGTLYYYQGNGLTWTAVSGARRYWICAERPGDVSLHVVGQSDMTSSVSGWQSNAWEDWGATYNSNQTFPYYVSDAICTGAATNDSLTTTVLSGGGSTNLVLSTNIIQTDNSNTKKINLDTAPALKAAMAQATNGHGCVYISPLSSGGFPINSFTSLNPANGVCIKGAGSLQLNDTLELGTANWDGSWSAAGTSQFAFNSGELVQTFAANPSIHLVGANAALSWIQLYGSNNAETLIDIDAGSSTLEHMSLASDQAAATDYLGQALVYRSLGSIQKHVLKTSQAISGPSQVTGSSWTPLIYVPFGQNGSGGALNSGTELIVNDFYGSRRAFGMDSGFSVLLHNAYVQGPIMPIMLFNPGAGGITSFIFDNVHNDTSGEPLMANLNVGSAQIYVNEASASQSNPIIAGARPAGISLYNVGFNGAAFPPDRWSTFCAPQSAIVAPFDNGIASPQAVVQQFCQIGNATAVLGGYPIIWPLAPPGSITTAVASGGSMPSGTFVYSVNATGYDGGETILQPIQSASVTTSGTCPASGNCSVTVGWNAVPGATSYNIWRCNTAGTCSTNGAISTGSGNWFRVATHVTGVSVVDALASSINNLPPNATATGSSGINATSIWASIIAALQSMSVGLTPPLAVCGTASGAICFGSGTVPCVPTAGQACIQFDKATDRFVYTLDGSPIAALVGSTGAPIDLTAQSAAIPATNINNSVPTTAVYRLCFSAAITTVGSVSSTLGGANGFQVIYTSPTDSIVKTTVPNAAWSSTANTTGTAVGGCQEVYAKAGTSLQYSFGYTSNAGGTMVYELHIREEDGN